VSISKRLIDLAKANLNALLDKAAGGEGPLADHSDEDLEAELARRRQRRLRENEERRDREAAERAARQRAADRAAAQKNARGVPPQSPRTPPPRGAPKPPPRQQARRPPPSTPAPPGSERRLRELYASLEVPYGAGFDEVKKSFRRLMRKYHPDLHVGNPAMHKTATQLTMSLTQAYNELEIHLVGGRRT